MYSPSAGTNVSHLQVVARSIDAGADSQTSEFIDSAVD
jgi:hypothetical protein